MAPKKNYYCQATIIKDGTRKTGLFADLIYSDAELNPPKSLFKRFGSNPDSNIYHLPDEVAGYPLIGFEDQFAKVIGGSCYLGRNFMFIPFNFLSVTGSSQYASAYMPDISASGQWRVDFYKKTVLENGITRRVRFDVKGEYWTIRNERDGALDLSNFSLMDSKARECILRFAGQGYNINRFCWSKETVAALEGWRPCLVRNDYVGPFSIEYTDSHISY